MFEFGSPFAFGYSGDSECIFCYFICDMLYVGVEFEFLIEYHAQIFRFSAGLDGCS